MATTLVNGRFFDYRAVGLTPGAALYTYAAGTLTPQATYTDQGGGSSNANPVICDVNGGADVWLGTDAYKFRLYTDTIANGGTLIDEWDHLSGGVTSADLASTASAAVGAGMVGFDGALSYATNTIGWALKKGFVNAAWFGAVGDGVTDDHAAIQAAINWAFNNNVGTVELPAGTFCHSKPLYIYGSDNYIRAGVRLVGKGVQATTLQKTGNGTTADGSWYGAIDACVILTPYPPPTTATPATGTYNVSLEGLTVNGYATTPNTYGVYTKDDFGQIKAKNLCVNGQTTTWRIDGNNWLSSYENISLHPVSNGFFMNAAGTSLAMKNVYVLGGNGTGFNLQSIYSTGEGLAVEGFTGTPFVFKFAQWVINGVGVECAAATGAAFNSANGSNVVLNSALVLCPNVYQVATGCFLESNGAQLGSSPTVARTGYHWFVAGTGGLHLHNEQLVDTYATANTGFALQTTGGTGGSGAFGMNKLEITGNTSTNSENALNVKNAAGTLTFGVRNDGVIFSGLAAASPYNNTSAVAANMGVDSGGVLFRSTSARKYKRDIEDGGWTMADVMKLRPVRYRGNAPGDGERWFGGFIAEEVDEAGLREFVEYGPDGLPDALFYAHKTALLAAGMQDLQRQIDELKARQMNVACQGDEGLMP